MGDGNVCTYAECQRNLIIIHGWIWELLKMVERTDDVAV